MANLIIKQSVGIDNKTIENNLKDDFIGSKFGRLTVIERCSHKNDFGHILYKSICECGNIRESTKSSLNKVKSCGCLNRELSSQRALNKSKNSIDKQDDPIIGKKFGRLTIIEKTNIKSNDNKYLYKVKCDCGNEKLLPKNNVVSMRTQSCGCFHKQALEDRHLEKRNSFNWQEFIGKQFGKLIVLEYKGYIDGSSGHSFMCECSCGNKKEFSHFNLNSGNSQSCGICVKKAKIKYLDKNIARNIKFLRYKFSRYFSKKIINRDNNYCILCKSDINLEAHHIIPIIKDKSLIFKCKNAVTLCTSCHFSKAHSGNTSTINLELQNEFLLYIKLKECFCGNCKDIKEFL